MTEVQKRMYKPMLSLRKLRLSLKYRPEILNLILSMKLYNKQKNQILQKVYSSLENLEKNIRPVKLPAQFGSKRELNKAGSKKKIPKSHNKSVQTENAKEFETEDGKKSTNNETVSKTEPEELGWQFNTDGTKTVTEQVKEAAQAAIKETGMVFVESAGMYYDYKTGYYYNPELGLYYHTDTDCYYYYSEVENGFVFHSYPVRSAGESALLAHERHKAKKNKKDKEAEEQLEYLTENLSQDGEVSKEEKKRKRPLIKKKAGDNSEKKVKKSDKEIEKKVPSPKQEKKDDVQASEQAEVKIETSSENAEVKKEKQEPMEECEKTELEDGECSDTASEADSDEEDVKSIASTATASDDDTIAKQYPPCMRVVVRETNITSLRVGSLFIVTKDGGTLGREGDTHTILLPDHLVSRLHLGFQYDEAVNAYTVSDLGSKNGTLFNGSRMAESTIYSEPYVIQHGSILQIGATKLLCHIHQGNDTCGHCEPGLIMEADAKATQVAYTRTCSVRKQHALELARLKNKFGVKQPLAIEATAYNDRAQLRRDTVGSSHPAEKTEAADLETYIGSNNIGFKLLEKMGWSQGEGLGKDNQGSIEPLPIEANAGKLGLGAPPLPRVSMPYKSKNRVHTLKLASRTKMLQPPAKEFQAGSDDESLQPE